MKANVMALKGEVPEVAKCRHCKLRKQGGKPHCCDRCRETQGQSYTFACQERQRRQLEIQNLRMEAMTQKRDLSEIIGYTFEPSEVDPASMKFSALQEKQEAEQQRQSELTGAAAGMVGMVLPDATAGVSKAGGAVATAE